MKNSRAFINCPFDNIYSNLFKALVLTLRFHGLKPFICSNTGLGSFRLDDIYNLCNDCTYSFHDISRNKTTKEKEVARFNMPFELGIDYSIFKQNIPTKPKIIFVLDNKKHEYKISISDLSGYDIINHSDNTDDLIEQIHLNITKVKNRFPFKNVNPSLIKGKLIEFNHEFNIYLSNHGYTDSFDQVIKYSELFINKFKKKKKKRR